MDSTKKFLKTINLTSFMGIRNLVITALVLSLVGGLLFNKGIWTIILEWWPIIIVAGLLVSAALYVWMLIAGRGAVEKTLHDVEAKAKKAVHDVEEKVKETAHDVSEKVDDTLGKAKEKLGEKEEDIKKAVLKKTTKK